MTVTKEWTFGFMLARFDTLCIVGYQKAAQGYLRKESRRFGYRETSCARKKNLSYHARPALISGMDFHQKWTKTKGGHDQIQIQIHKYKYKYAHTNTNTNASQSRSQILTFGSKKKFSRKQPYLWNRLTDIASTPLKSKLLACATWKTPQVVSNMPWEHRRARGASFRGGTGS